MEIFAALTLGLLGSLHCIGMCGPIAVALPVKQNNFFARTSSAFLYNIGRTITYGILGALFGLFGQGLVLAGFQQWTSIAVGGVMILSVIIPNIAGRRIESARMFDWVGKRLNSGLKRYFTSRSYTSLFVIGLLNGLLPCGLVYIALAGAIATSHVLDGALYMVVFGLGTIPALLVVTLAGNFVSLKFRNSVRRIVPVFIILIGLLFILRGMNLGIPYVSPKMEKADEKVEMKCCDH